VGPSERGKRGDRQARKTAADATIVENGEAVQQEEGAKGGVGGRNGPGGGDGNLAKSGEKTGGFLKKTRVGRYAFDKKAFEIGKNKKKSRTGTGQHAWWLAVGVGGRRVANPGREIFKGGQEMAKGLLRKCVDNRLKKKKTVQTVREL